MSQDNKETYFSKNKKKLLVKLEEIKRKEKRDGNGVDIRPSS